MKFSEQFEELHKVASESAGLDDFGSTDYEEPLRLLLSDLDRHSDYNELGVQSILGHIMMLLVGKLVAQKSMTDHPELLNTPVSKPVFIVGPPRSGTTVLHRLITNDPGIQTLPFWLGAMPVPRPPREEWKDHPLFQVVDRDYVEKLYEARPETRILHPMQADKPEECRWIVEQGMWSTFFAGATDAPNYTKWAMEADTRPYYEYYRKVLSVISNGDTRPWILKDPGHIFCIDALMSVFPDACIVQTHREPVTGIASTSNMLWSMRKGLEPNLTMKDVGDLVLKTWAKGLAKMEEARHKYDERRFLDVHMLETRRDPMATMQRIYEYFDMPLGEATLTAWHDELERDPNQEHSIGKYDPADFGINEDTIAEPIGAYNERYKKVCKAAGV